MSIPSLSPESVLSVLEGASPRGLRVAELAGQLGVLKSKQRALRKLLADLERRGAIQGDGDRYSLGVPATGRAAAGGPDRDRVIGRISVHPAGYGFVVTEDGADDVFVPAKYRGAALDGDQVALSTWVGVRGTEGSVQEVLARGRAKLTGTLRRAGRRVYLEPDDPRIATAYGSVPLVDGAARGRPGDAVIVEIVQYPTDARAGLRGRLARVLGDPDDPRTEIEKILACADISGSFPHEAERQAERTPDEVRAEDLADRIDLRDRPFVTIDPETARDFDDALCVEDGPGGAARVWIAVADVSHYVRGDDPLDREAAIRAVSVYLPDRVIPMLPLPLSAGICSLNPDVDRCAMVVRLDFQPDGTIVDRGFAAAVIRSHARLDYPGVAAALSGDLRGRRAEYRRWLPMLERLSRLGQVLRRRRIDRGSLDLELPEAKVVLDADDPRLIRDVVRAKGTEGVKQAYQLVEEFMIAANEAVGRFFAERGLPSVWRVHAPPEQDRVEELAQLMSRFDVKVDVSAALTPRGMQAVLAQLGGKPAARALGFAVLRALKQAVYDTEPIGHFGLASPEYLHFTSPIRRYPDLLVHRLLKLYLHREGQASGGARTLRPLTRERLQELAQATSHAERRAMEAEREAVSMYRAYLMRDQIGESFTGRVSAVTSFGVFVELDEPFVEGMIKLDTLGDGRMVCDVESGRVHAERSGFALGLGDAVEVEVIDVSVSARRIQLKLLSAGGNPAPQGGGGRERGRAGGNGGGKGAMSGRGGARPGKGGKKAARGRGGAGSNGKGRKR